MKRIPLMLFCVSMAIASCKKESPEPTNTPPSTTTVEEPGEWGSQMVGTWSMDSIRFYGNHSPESYINTTYYPNSYITIEFKSIDTYGNNNVYKETGIISGQPIDRYFSLHEYLGWFRYSTDIGIILEPNNTYKVIEISPDKMVTEYYAPDLKRWVRYFSR